MSSDQSQPFPDAQKQFHQIVGGIRVANKIRESIGSQTMSALLQVQEQRLYLQEGFETFADFLDKSPYSPMSKNKYYELKKFYEKEAPEEFDLLNSVNPAVAERRLLTAGDISLDGDQVIVGDTPYQIGDKKGIKKAITRLIEQQKVLASEQSKAEKEIKKLTKQRDEAQEQAAAAPSASDLGDPADIAKLRIISGLTTLKRELLRLPLAERQARFADYRRGIEQSIEDLFLSLSQTTAAAPAASDDTFDLSDEDLNELMED